MKGGNADSVDFASNDGKVYGNIAAEPVKEVWNKGYGEGLRGHLLVELEVGEIAEH